MIDHFSLVQQALSTLDHSAVQRAIDIIKAAKQRGSMVFICGNGGSAATASHFACDLQKAAGVRAIALTDNVPLITAWANDEDYSHIFVEQLNRLINDGDVIFSITCSGNSDNVVKAAHASLKSQMAIPRKENFTKTISLVGGFQEQAIRWYSGVSIMVMDDDYAVIEDVHLSICHAITKGVASE